MAIAIWNTPDIRYVLLVLLPSLCNGVPLHAGVILLAWLLDSLSVLRAVGASRYMS
jgi:hypothetical protein